MNPAFSSVCDAVRAVPPGEVALAGGILPGRLGVLPEMVAQTPRGNRDASSRATVVLPAEHTSTSPARRGLTPFGGSARQPVSRASRTVWKSSKGV